jgi:DNA-binding response OmpR family regulator
MNKPLVLIVDDDAELSGMVAELLQREGLAVHTVLTAGDGERALAQWKPDAVLLDVMLPDANGFDLCRRWRASHPPLGILMLTARGDPMDRVLGLEIGADDYLPKPFEPRELVARLRALLRRQMPGRAQATQLRFDGLTIDLLKREVLAGAAPVARAAERSRTKWRIQTAGPHGGRAGCAPATEVGRSRARQRMDRYRAG